MTATASQVDADGAKHHLILKH